MKSIILLLLLLPIILLTGCSVPVSQNTEIEDIKQFEHAEECINRVVEVKRLCKKADLEKMDIQTLKECIDVFKDEEGYLTSCDYEFLFADFGEISDDFAEPTSSYEKEASKRCNKNIGTMNVDEFIFCFYDMVQQECDNEC